MIYDLISETSQLGIPCDEGLPDQYQRKRARELAKGWRCDARFKGLTIMDGYIYMVFQRRFH